MKQLVSIDRTQQIPTTGIIVVPANPRRLWMAFTNEGPNFIDLMFLGRDGATVTGRIRLQSGQGAWFDRNNGMRWDDSLSATADTATTTLAGVEVEEWD